MARPSSTDRLVRLLALPAWVAEHDGATLTEAAAHFGVGARTIGGGTTTSGDTGSGISYNVSSILGAAIAPFIATALVNSYGVASVGVYLAVVTGITLIAVFCMPETRDIDMREV
mgnify:CR=1 FL=1